MLVVKSIWILIMCHYFATIQYTEAKVYKGYARLFYASDTTCANAMRKLAASLTLFRMAFLIVNKDDSIIIKSFRISTTYLEHAFDGRHYYVDFKDDEILYDDEKHDLIITTAFIRNYDQRVNDNPICFQSSDYNDFVKEHKLKPTGSGLDFSTMYYGSPVRPYFTLNIGPEEDQFVWEEERRKYKICSSNSEAQGRFSPLNFYKERIPDVRGILKWGTRRSVKLTMLIPVIFFVGAQCRCRNSYDIVCASPGTPNETSSTQVIQENVASERLLRTQESVDLAQTPPSMQSLKLSNQICDWLELSKTQRSIVRNLYKMRHKNCFEIINQ
ncbi:hypothetical protein Y032_0050g1922 [Ancylostoma ceylanicum]|uniref:Uncharacterized protein n=1 Tax=Ancylostoma ceylanicum TaxID=53326 RepID=A0A016U9C5_9BILA|nr:hypothetical protein Y032_0050g1922 [Ancylostoma ceylanicum]